MLTSAANSALDNISGERSERSNIAKPRVAFTVYGTYGTIPFTDRRYVITEGREVVLYEGSIDFDWTVQYGRNGAIAISRAGDRIQIQIPVRFSGHGGIAGDFSRALSTTAKNFRGSGRINILGRVDLGSDFCPRIVNPEAEFNWEESASIQVIGRSCLPLLPDSGQVCAGPWNLDIGQYLTGQIRDALRDQISSINSRLPCDSVRADLARFWRTHSVPLPLQDGPPLFVNVVPSRLAAPGMTAHDAGISATARLDAEIAVSTERIEERSIGELPQNAAITDPEGRVELAIPFFIRYETLSNLIRDQLQQRALVFESESPSGKELNRLNRM